MQQTIVFVFSKTELNEKYLHAFNLSTKNLNRITIKVSEECNEKLWEIFLIIMNLRFMIKQREK